MIKIIDDWYITVETNPINYAINYVVRKGNGERREKKGWSDDAKGYFTSLRGALKFIREQIIAERLSTACTPLPDAITAISEVDARFEKIMESVTA